MTLHKLVFLVDDYSKRGLPKGSKGTIIYTYSNNETFEVEFENNVILTLQHYQINMNETS